MEADRFPGCVHLGKGTRIEARIAVGHRLQDQNLLAQIFHREPGIMLHNRCTVADKIGKFDGLRVG